MHDFPFTKHICYLFAHGILKNMKQDMERVFIIAI